MTDHETAQHRERRNNAERLACALERFADECGMIQQLSLRIHYDRAQLVKDIHDLYDFVNEYAWKERDSEPAED